VTAEAIAFVGVAAQAERMLGNARRLDSSAAALALGLELAAPAPGRVWLARCVWCLERDERTRGEAAAVLRPVDKVEDRWGRHLVVEMPDGERVPPDRSESGRRAAAASPRRGSGRRRCRSRARR